MKKNKILFAGSSNTFGCGLELEFRPRYNNHEWLLENGIDLPNLTNINVPKDQKIRRKYRWSSLVCKELGYEEFNIHDNLNVMGGNAVETIWLLNEEKKLLNILDDVKYVILEMGQVRWWNKKLHGENEKKYPNTITEVLNFIENPEISHDDRLKAINWLYDVDIEVYFETAAKKLLELQSKYKDIKFLWLPWSGEKTPKDNLIKFNELENCMIDLGVEPPQRDYNVFPPQYREKSIESVLGYLKSNKMRIGDTAKCFNGDYKYTYKDDHANAEGHKWIASIIVKYIRGLEKN